MIFAVKGAFCQLSLSGNNRMVNRPPFSTGYNPDFFTLKFTHPIPADFYCKQLGFFCKKERKMEFVTGIPFRFRLGSLQYNDWMEGKKNSGILFPP